MSVLEQFSFYEKMHTSFLDAFCGIFVQHFSQVIQFIGLNLQLFLNLPSPP